MGWRSMIHVIYSNVTTTHDAMSTLNFMLHLPSRPLQPLLPFYEIGSFELISLVRPYFHSSFLGNY
jgi:hypothetical protein